MNCTEPLPPEDLPALLCFCRLGFEADCAAELVRREGRPGGRGRFEDEAGWVLYRPAGGAEALHRGLDFRRLIFCRQWQVAETQLALKAGGPASDMADALSRERRKFSGVSVAVPDNPRARALWGHARKLEGALERELRSRGRLARESAWQARVCLLDEGLALVDRALGANSSPHVAGIPRLKLPPDSPSRSALKLEGALAVLLDQDERRRLLRPGLRAVDLGAAPGGWSHALSRRGLLVTAVDRARLAPQVAGNELVEHVRADGFAFRPPRPVEWLFCDIVDQPSRVAARVAEWLCRGWCRRALFNLKLPMKKRLDQVERDLSRLGRALSRLGRPDLRCRHLYHDRLEVTCYAAAGR